MNYELRIRSDVDPLPERSARPAGLTNGERKALACAALGDSIIETAERLGLSPETVKSQRKSAMQRYRARTIAHAVACAFRAGDLA